MYALAKKFFGKFDAPGAPFVLGENGTFSTYMSGHLGVKVYDSHYSVKHTAHQLMTPAGLTTAELGGMGSDFDGVSQWYVDAEGNAHVAKLLDALKSIHGLPPSGWAATQEEAWQWDWTDNHVALLVNCLRYVMMREISAAGDNTLSINLPRYVDDSVTINRNNMFGEGYAQEAIWGWPTGISAGCVPRFIRIKEMIAQSSSPAVDLTTLNTEEATFIAMMMCSWVRKSKYRLDFSLPCLASEVLYRASVDIPTLAFTVNAPPHRRTALPPLTPKEVAWVALKKYVSVNRLFAQFSVALYAVCGMTYQFLPSTAESQYWLKINWTLALPKFHPIRGRSPLLLNEQPAYTSRRALDEWQFINGKIEKVNLMALLFAQAAFTGFGVRSTRFGIEDYPEDLVATRGPFYTDINMFSAAAAECTRSPVPLSGMEEVYIYCNEDFDAYNEDRYVVLHRDSLDDLGAREVVVVDVDEEYVETITGEEALTQGLIHVAAPEVSREEIAAITAEAKAKFANASKSNKKALVAEEVEARRQALIAERTEELPQEVEVERTRVVPQRRLVVGRIPLAGYPVLLVPLDSFGYKTPLSLEGEVSRADGDAYHNELHLSWVKVWQLAHINMLCEGGITIADDGHFVGPAEFLWPDDVNLAWPLLRQDRRATRKAVVTGQVEGRGEMVEIPDLATPAYEDKIYYSIRAPARGLSEEHHTPRKPIQNYGAATLFKLKTTPGKTAPEAVSQLRGFITRQSEKLAFVPENAPALVPATKDAGGETSSKGAKTMVDVAGDKEVDEENVAEL